MQLELIRVSVDDAELIWKMQLESFAGLLDTYRDYDTSPGSESIEKVIWRLSQPTTYFYLIQGDAEPVGAIRILDSKDGITRKRISPLFVLPRYWGKGIAQWAISEVERIHGSEHWELDTILQEKGNCHLYEKMGYHTTGKTEPVNDSMTLVFYEK